jgi:hypothetical protein
MFVCQIPMSRGIASDTFHFSENLNTSNSSIRCTLYFYDHDFCDRASGAR